MFTVLYLNAEVQLRKVSLKSPFDKLLGLVVQELDTPVDRKNGAKTA